MTRSEFALIMSAIWLAPLSPGIENLVIGIVFTVFGGYFLWKDKK